jgi:hypothetical protein
MAKAKIDKKFFVTELNNVVGDAPWTPVFADNEGQRVLSLDSDVIKGAFYMETAWFLPGDWPEKTGSLKSRTIGAHTHDYDETIAWSSGSTANKTSSIKVSSPSSRRESCTGRSTSERSPNRCSTSQLGWGRNIRNNSLCRFGEFFRWFLVVIAFPARTSIPST